MRKRFAEAKERTDIDNNFDMALAGVREHRMNEASKATTVKPGHRGTLTVQPTGFSENAKPMAKQNLLTERTTPPTAGIPPQMMREMEELEGDDSFVYIDAEQPLSQKDMELWVTMSGLG